MIGLKQLVSVLALLISLLLVVAGGAVAVFCSGNLQSAGFIASFGGLLLIPIAVHLCELAWEMARLEREIAELLKEVEGE